MTEGSIAVEGGRLWYERAGEGFPVVLLHPALWDSRIWDVQFDAFTAFHDVVRYDRRGHGRSDTVERPYSDLRDLGLVLDGLGISRCALVGCAGGAQLALDLAVASPALVDAIVPVSPRVSGRRWEDEGLEVLEREVEAAVHDGDLERAMAIELAVWAPLSTGSPDSTARRIAFENAGVLALDGGRDEPPGSAVERLGDVAAATLVVVGDRDLEEIHQIADLLERSIPGASKRVIANADELVMVARPDRFNQVVLDFLAFRM